MQLATCNPSRERPDRFVATTHDLVGVICRLELEVRSSESLAYLSFNAGNILGAYFCTE